MQEAYLRFWGVRGSYAVPAATHLRVGGNTSCVEIRADDHVLICDAGTGIIGLGDKLLGEARRLPLMVLLTHYHWDHICGLPLAVRRSFPPPTGNISRISSGRNEPPRRR